VQDGLDNLCRFGLGCSCCSKTLANPPSYACTAPISRRLRRPAVYGFCLHRSPPLDLWSLSPCKIREQCFQLRSGETEEDQGAWSGIHEAEVNFGGIPLGTLAGRLAPLLPASKYAYWYLSALWWCDCDEVGVYEPGPVSLCGVLELSLWGRWVQFHSLLASLETYSSPRTWAIW